MHDDAGQVLGSAGCGEQFEALGQTWRLGFVTQQLKAEFAAWCRMLGRRQLADDGLPPASLNPVHYTWGISMGQAIREALADAAGQQHLTFLLLRQQHCELTDVQALEIYQAANADVLGACLRYLLGWDPNRKPPVA